MHIIFPCLVESCYYYAEPKNINIHRCYWQNHHNSAKTSAITTNIDTKLLNGYKLKVNKNGVHSSKHFCKNFEKVDGGGAILHSPATQNKVKKPCHL